jgi:hypothetical protein
MLTPRRRWWWWRRWHDRYIGDFGDVRRIRLFNGLLREGTQFVTVVKLRDTDRGRFLCGVGLAVGFIFEFGSGDLKGKDAFGCP